jgi:hypothetical protein
LINSVPPMMHIELSCSVCDEPEILILKDASGYLSKPEGPRFFPGGVISHPEDFNLRHYPFTRAAILY